jgi:hypothetical protein
MFHPDARALKPKNTNRKKNRHFVWILIGLCGTLPVMATTFDAGAGTKVVKSSRDPAFVTVRMDSPAGWLKSTAAMAELRDEIARDLGRAADLQQQRVITLRLAGYDVEFERLPADVRKAVAAISGTEAPKNFYERRLAAVLRDAMAAARANRPPLMFSVQGLPLENAAGGGKSLDITNRNYREVIASMEVVVSPRTLLVRGGDAGALARNALPQAFRHANGRAVFFKTNNGWRIGASTEGPRTISEGSNSMMMVAAAAQTASGPFNLSSGATTFAN